MRGYRKKSSIVITGALFSVVVRLFDFFTALPFDVDALFVNEPKERLRLLVPPVSLDDLTPIIIGFALVDPIFLDCDCWF